MAKFDDLVGTTLVNSQGDEVATAEVLKGKKLVMFYFAGHKDKKCKSFTPILVGAYEAHKEFLTQLSQSGGSTDDVGEIEVIFISHDKTKSDYDKSRSTMPWLSVPLLNSWKTNEKLTKKYGVDEFPALIVMDGARGKVLSKNGLEKFTQIFKGEYDTSGGKDGCTIS